MELLKMTSESVISRKRPLDNSNGCKHRTMVQAVRDFPPGCGINESERKPLKILTKSHSDIGKITSHGSETKPKELERNKSSVASRPAGKVKFWDPMCTKGGYGQKPKVTTTIGTKERLVKNIDMNLSNIDTNISNVDMNIRKMPLNEKDKLVNSQPVEKSKAKSFVPKELGRSKSYLSTRSSKVKYWDPTCEAQKLEDTVAVVSEKEQSRHKQIKMAKAVFDEVYEQFCKENKTKPDGLKMIGCRGTMEAAKIVKQRLNWVDPDKTLGPVCGVQIGDTFKYRALLVMFGLHCQYQSGIDFVNIEGNNVAISIVDAHRYSNESESSDTLAYSGQGGVSLFGCKLPPEDQKLEKGNRALKNSMDRKTVVRVIRKVADGFGKEVFVYDGLYIVDHYTDEKSAEGKTVFKFHLNRVPGQPSLHKMLKL